MSNVDTPRRSLDSCMNIDFMRSLVKQYSELGQWTSALFWADAAAAAAGNGLDAARADDIWLLASAMLSLGELHRAAHAVTSRGLHKQHLLCLGVAMRAYLAAKEPASALNLIDEADPMLLESNPVDQTHNRALAGVLVSQARALSLLERRDAAAKTLTTALRADCACYEALDLLLEQHILSPREERKLIGSLDVISQLGTAEGTLVREAYLERLQRYSPPAPSAPPPDSCPVLAEVEAVQGRMAEAAAWRGRRLAAACRWRQALAALDAVDPWCCAEVRAACLVELKRSSELFAFAHTLVDAYPTAWTSWFAVGCYYYLIGKSEFARRYLSKAKSLEPSAGCVWLAYGHSFAHDNEHDQAMAAYFKASQLMAGCHLPPLYVAVECSLLNNVAMCERFLFRAAAAHNNAETGVETDGDGDGDGGGGGGGEGGRGWERLAGLVRDGHVAHEAGAAALAAGEPGAAAALWLRALDAAALHHGPALHPRWAATLDGLVTVKSLVSVPEALACILVSEPTGREDWKGHAARAAGRPQEALGWHERALSLRPRRASSLSASGLCLALLGREPEAADALHAALARDPDDAVAAALLDAILDKLDDALTEEDIPKFPFVPIKMSLPDASPTPAATDATTTSDMSMSFD